jgi:VanZ family protein
MSRRAAKLSLAIAAAAWAAVTVDLLAAPSPPATPGSGGGSMLTWLIPLAGHLGVFAIGAGIHTLLALTARAGASRIWFVAIVLGNGAFGAALELYQSTMPERHASWADVATNPIGALGGVIALLTVARLLTARRQVASDPTGRP